MKANFDEIDDIALQVVRADMARIHGEPLPSPPPQVVQPEYEEHELPLFLRRQAE